MSEASVTLPAGTQQPALDRLFFDATQTTVTVDLPVAGSKLYTEYVFYSSIVSGDSRSDSRDGSDATALSINFTRFQISVRSSDPKTPAPAGTTCFDLAKNTSSCSDAG